MTHAAEVAKAIGTLKKDDLADAGYDPKVLATLLARPALVAQWEAVRRIATTAARRWARYRGVAAPGAVVLVLDRREINLPDPTLGNRSGKGWVLRFYTGATPTARPLNGDGVLVKHKTDLHLESYARLGPDPDAPFLPVMLEGVDGERAWLVE